MVQQSQLLTFYVPYKAWRQCLSHPSSEPENSAYPIHPPVYTQEICSKNGWGDVSAENVYFRNKKIGALAKKNFFELKFKIFCRKQTLFEKNYVVMEKFWSARTHNIHVWWVSETHRHRLDMHLYVINTTHTGQRCLSTTFTKTDWGFTDSTWRSDGTWLPGHVWNALLSHLRSVTWTVSKVVVIHMIYGICIRWIVSGQRYLVRDMVFFVKKNFSP